MYNTSFIKKILVAATVVLLYSCDKDFNAIGDELIGDNHFDLAPEKYDVLAYNQEVTPIQSNGLAVNALGIYDNPVLGTTTGNYVTQVSLPEYAPTIGEAPEIVSVVLSVPYFSHVKTTNADGTRVFELDSIYGPAEGKLKLSVYESGVQMRNSFFDNGTQLPQYYYTDENTAFNTYKLGSRLNSSSDASQNDAFFFDAKELEDKTVDATTGKETVKKVSPQMRLNLNTDFFLKKILQAPAAKLASATVFQDYFRGLYFNVEKSGASPSNMALLDFAKDGKITIKYKARTAITTDPEGTMEEKTLEILLTGATASLVQDAKSTAYTNAITESNINRTEGDENLFIKGGQGSVSVIELNGFASQLADIRTKNWLVNEANLVFYVDSDKMAVKGTDNLQADEPKRIYLYDLTNNLPLIDYSDGTTGFLNNDSKQTRYMFGGLITRDETTKRGKSYKIRITNHIRNLIKDATAVNVKLGLVVTEDIGTIASNKLKLKNNVISEAPRASVMSPLGTVLYGGKSSVADDKRLRLEIYYTKPN